jgi:D-aspartate ligase
MLIKEQPFMPVIIGADINAYTIARTFHEEYQVKSIVLSKYLWGPSNNSKIIENIVEERLEEKDVFIETLITIAKNKSNKKLILFACGDWYIKMIVQNKKKLAKYYIIPYVSYNLMKKLVMKDSFYQICSELEIDHPETFVYDVKENTKLDFNFGYPVAAKAVDGVAYHYAQFPGKKKGFKFHDQNELETMLNNLRTSSYEGKFLIQDYIPGADSNMYVLTCYSDKKGKVKFYALGHVLLEEHTPGAIGNYVAIKNEVNEEIFAQAKRFLEHVKYTGFSNFDIKYDPRDGKYKFFEINTRLGRSNYYVTASGYNVAKFIVDEYIYDKEIKPIVAKKEHLFLAVPKLILFRYLHDQELKKQVKILIKKKQVSHPLIYKKDMNFKRYFYIKASMLNQIRKYYKYYEIIKESIKKEKFVGVIGGLGPLATTYFMDLVINNTDANKDQDHVNMIVINHATIPDRTQYLMYKGIENPALKMIEDAKKLEQMGANFIVIPCNTVHAFYKQIKGKVNIPIINIIEETILYALKENPELKKVGLLATKATVEHHLYEKVMNKYGIKCILPTEEEQVKVDELIYDGIKAGKEIDIESFHQIIDSLVAQGVEKIILGCTELSIINKNDEIKNDIIIDSLTVLALKTILLSGKNIKETNNEE